jgi:hypothetical protein
MPRVVRGAEKWDLRLDLADPIFDLPDPRSQYTLHYDSMKKVS